MSAKNCMISTQRYDSDYLKHLLSKLASELGDIHVFVSCGVFLITLVTLSDQDVDEDDYNTMVVKEDDNESVVSTFMFLGLDKICLGLLAIKLGEKPREISKPCGVF